MNEVANALIGSSVELGIVPCGSGNGLARHLGIPLDIEAAMQISTSSPPIDIDCGKVGDRFFLNVMGIGIDAEICNRFDKSKRGFVSYVREGLSTFVQYKPSLYNIKVDDVEVDEELCMIAIANSSQYGNSAYIAPNASLKDGIFRVVYLNKPSSLRLLLLCYRLFFRTIERASFVTSVDASTITISSNKEYLYHLDGEVQAATAQLKVSIVPKCLRVVPNANLSV